MEDVCVEVSQKDFLGFCTQMEKQGCDVVSVNTFDEACFVWLVNSPLLQTQISNTQRGTECAGFSVRLLPGKKRGTTCKTLKNASYYDLLITCDRTRPVSWSSPTCTNINKCYYLDTLNHK